MRDARGSEHPPSASRRRASTKATRSAAERKASRLRDLRAAGPPEEGLLILTARVRIPPDIWTGVFSSRHPSIRLEVLNRTDLSEDTSVSDYWISGKPPGAWAAAIAEFPDVLRIESLAEVADGCIYRVRYRNPPVVYAYRRIGLPLQFPLKIQAGTLTWEVIGRRTDADKILAFARTRDPNLQVLSIRRRGLRTHLPLLTMGQQRLLADAMSAGYFAVPREITLTDLAHRLGRSKSALSEALALIEKKLLESALRPTSLP